METKKDAMTPEESRMVVFQEKSIRRILYENEWWFSVIDVVAVLSETTIIR